MQDPIGATRIQDDMKIDETNDVVKISSKAADEEDSLSVVSSIATMSLTPPEQLHHPGFGGGMRRTASQPSFKATTLEPCNRPKEDVRAVDGSLGDGLSKSSSFLDTQDLLRTIPAPSGFEFPEDEAGEPIMDEAMLKDLETSQMARYQDVIGDTNNPLDAIMLESSSSHEEEDTIHTGGTPSSFLPFGGESIRVNPALTQSISALSLNQSLEYLSPLVVDPTKQAVSEDEGDTFLRTNSLLNLHHGRHPSTIAEEMTNSVADAINQQQQYHDDSLEQEHPLLKKPPPPTNPLLFSPHYSSVQILGYISQNFFLLAKHHQDGAATWIAFWALLHVTCANYVLTPIRDAIALTQVDKMPQLTLASTILALISSVPIGWLFEAPDPNRRRLWKRMGLTRGETQGTSLALLYRLFGMVLLMYAFAFEVLENDVSSFAKPDTNDSSNLWLGVLDMSQFRASVAKAIYIAFFLMVHLMKLHCLSLVWGVTTEAMEYEEVARKQYERQESIRGIERPKEITSSSKMRLKRLSLVGFGGTMGGILGSFLASSMAQIVRLSGLLVFAALLLEMSAELSIELGRIMQMHWEGQQHLFQSTTDLTSLDPSMVRSSSLGSMKRISSGNSLNRTRSSSELNNGISSSKSMGNLSSANGSLQTEQTNGTSEDAFWQRMLRGVRTILKSRLLMAIFTYNALYASTNVLLSFQRAHLVANRDSSTNVQGDTAFLANINMASSFATFALQATGTGVFVANLFGLRGTLALMPFVRFLGVVSLAWWHKFSGGKPPNLFIFLIVDECCKVMNLAVAKPVRESLWRGLSNEARYEAKPLSDTLSNRWGGGSAAFLVSSVDKLLDIMHIEKDVSGVRNICGLTPTIFLCLVISAWWAAVSADLGQIRNNIDLALKKRQ